MKRLLLALAACAIAWATGCSGGGSTTITPPPAVISTIPVNGATGVPISQVLSVTFNEPMNCATIASPATAFTLTGPGATTAAGYPEEVPGTTIDRQCGSSQQALHFAAQAVMSGTNDVIVAGQRHNIARCHSPFVESRDLDATFTTLFAQRHLKAPLSKS